VKIKTSIILSEDVLKAVDKRTKQQQTRSDFIEIINRKAEALNREAAEVREYQVLP